MKRANCQLTAVVLAVVLGGPAIAGMDTAPLRPVQGRSAPGPNVALYRVEKVNLVVWPAAAAPDHNEAFWGRLQREIKTRLETAGLIILDAGEPNSPAGPDPAAAVARIGVRVNAAVCAEAAKYVFTVRTSLLRPVHLRGQQRDASSRQRRFETVAEVWHKASGILLASDKQASAQVTEVVSGQIEAFVAEWAATNPPGRDIFEADRSTAAPAGRAETPAAPAEYKYVASRNSKVFHLPGCSSARRIAPGNLTGYNSRDEAIKAGKRPCKLCKP